jgi:spermidine/putrescine transport system substrate-binding protein
MRKSILLLGMVMILIVSCQPAATPTATRAPTPTTAEEPTEAATDVETEEPIAETEEAATEEMEAEAVATEEVEAEAAAVATEEAAEVESEVETEEADTEEAVVVTDEAEPEEPTEAAVMTEEAEDEEAATEEAEGPAPTAAPAATAEEEAAAWTCPEGFEGQTLNVFNWSTYIADDTVANFEAACGVTVVYSVYGNNEELLGLLRQGNAGYDIAVPTDSYVATMIADDLLEPIDLDNIPNFANVSANLQDPAYDPGNQYSVPYQWGTVGIGYNSDAVGEEITSWDQMWSYDGPVAWLDDIRAMLGIALNNLGFDPNTTDVDEINQARDYLVENGENVVAIAADDGQVLLERGEADIVVEYSGDIFQVMAECECDNIAYVIPEEGTQLWVDNMVIPAGAPNPALAEVFMDYILDPQVSADIANYTAYATPNQASIDQGLIDEELLSNPAIYPSEDVIANLFIINEVPDAQNDYNNAWDEIKVRLGQ